LICGSLVLLGLGTRIASVPLIATMVVALLTAKASEIAGLSDLIGTIELCYALLLAWLALAGPGTASLDHWIAQVLAQRVPPEARPPRCPPPWREPPPLPMGAPAPIVHPLSIKQKEFKTS
jgi:hypothetical protein